MSKQAYSALSGKGATQGLDSGLTTHVVTPTATQSFSSRVHSRGILGRAYGRRRDHNAGGPGK